jgi:glucose dehydrogenase
LLAAQFPPRCAKEYPSNRIAAPITAKLSHANPTAGGRQHVISAGGHRSFGTRAGAWVIAYSLSD